MFGIGMPEMLVIGGVVVLLFGATKLPQLGGAVGESIKNFRKSVRDDNKAIDGEKKSKSKEENEE